MESCYSLLERQKYSEALQILLDQLQEEFPKPRVKLIYYLIQILGISNEYKKLQIQILKLLRYEEKEESEYCELFLELIRLYIENDQINEAYQALQTLNRIIQEEKIESTSLIFMTEEIDKMLQQSIQLRKNENHKDELFQYERLREEEKNVKYFENDGLFAYLIPTSWFRRWQRYVSEGDEMNQEDPLADVDKNIIIQLEKLFKLNDETVVEEDSIYPGPIDATKLLEYQHSLIIDPFEPKKYTNYVLKGNLREGEDFLMVGFKTYKFLSSIYGGFEVKRMIVERSVNNQKYVDLMPKVITFTLIPPEEGENLKFYKISANNYDTFQEFTKKVRRVFDYHEEIRWWKFQNPNENMEWLQKASQGNINPNPKAKIIEQKVILEELNIVVSDIYLCEVKVRKNWLLSEDKSRISSNHNNVSHLFNKFSISETPKMRQECRKGVTGLQNLGNTCFMNAALQCLSNTYELTEYMVTNQFAHDLNINNPLGTQGYMAVNYAEIMKTMWFGTSSSISAYELKRTIGKFAPQFYGYGQQDSHEFLSYLLDGLHEDLNRVIKKPVVPDIEITNETDSQASLKFSINYSLRNQSKIQELMVGQYKSTLVCPQCQRISKTFDPFMSISLPIPSYQSIHLSLYLIYEDSEQIPSKIGLSLTSDMTAFDIARKLALMVDISQDRLNLILVKEHHIKERVDPRRNVKWINDHEGMLFVEEVSQEYFSLRDDEIHMDIYYYSKAIKIYENDKIASYPRQLVVKKGETIQQLYLRIYEKLRVHIMFALKEMNEKDFPQKEDFLALQKPTTLVECYQELKLFNELGKMPFVLKLKSNEKSKATEYQFENLTVYENFGNKIIVDVFFNEQLSRQIQTLKLQRCKDFNNVQQNDSRRKGEYTLEDCFRAFSKEEILGKGDEWYCNKCKVHVQASKKMEIYKAPQILIVHLKRFKTNKISNFGNYYFTGGPQKITSLVNFPMELNLNHQILSKQNQDPIDYTYDLFGVDNHYGGIGGGHYTACAFNPILKKWIDFNDSSVRVSSSDVVSEAAYLLFYRRRDSPSCNLSK